MADFLPQTVLNVNYGRQGRAVFQLTTPLHFVCRWVVQNTRTQSHFVKQWQRTQYWFFSLFLTAGLAGVVVWTWVWGGWVEELTFSVFPRVQSWFNGNLSFHQRTLWCVDYQNLFGKVQHLAINSLARTEFTEMWKGYGLIERMWLSCNSPVIFRESGHGCCVRLSMAANIHWVSATLGGQCYVGLNPVNNL